jgi:hypothetical protein
MFGVHGSFARGVRKEHQGRTVGVAGIRADRACLRPTNGARPGGSIWRTRRIGSTGPAPLCGEALRHAREWIARTRAGSGARRHGSPEHAFRLLGL